MTAQHSMNWVEQGYVPDSIIRKGIRRLLNNRLNEIAANDIEQTSVLKHQFIENMSHSPIALSPEKANQQHYEVPAKFYELVLGEHRKYSCSYWDDTTTLLNDAEMIALSKTCEHANLANGQNILELGCGWGSLTLWMAIHYPESQITAVSNSVSQKVYLDQVSKLHGIKNIQVITSDMNEFSTTQRFDRVVSVEMFEHMRNWQQLFSQISRWLNKDGQFFMHVFIHRTTPYAFECENNASVKSDWMSEYFFTGGMMPSADLALYFQEQLKLTNSWAWDGNHYAKTCRAWLKNMDQQKAEILPLLKATYGEKMQQIWWMRWRIFFMACEELFASDNGQQWHVMHYLFKNS